MGWRDIPSAEETEIPKDLHQDHQDVVHKEFIREGKTVNAEFDKGVMDRLLKRIQGFIQLRFSIKIFSCCTIMRPPTKLQVFANF
jgi:hypothetical protein